MRYLIKFSYDGSGFSGYQKQDGKRTIEEEIENAVSYINNKTETVIYASGRTDKGVHARRQFAHFDLYKEIDCYKIKSALNSKLPDDIYIIDVYKVDDSFNARFMVKDKTYSYYLNIGEYSPTKRNYCYQYCKSLDIDKMKRAIKLFEGIHDFRSFVSSEDKRDNMVREIYFADINVYDNIICFRFNGNGFMKYQVRNMVGLLIEIGNGKKSINDIIKIFDKKDRRYAGIMAPSCGLYLEDVNYGVKFN